MTDLDQRISSTLRERAEGAVDTNRLTARAVAGGRARRRRRRAGAGVALGLTAALGAGVIAGLPSTGPAPQLAAPAVVAVAPPRADGIPGAAARPDLIGSDPQVLHFGADPARVRYLGWEVARGVESVQIDVGSGRAVTVDLARSSGALRQRPVEGLPGELGNLAAEAAFDGRAVRLGPDARPVLIRHWHPASGLFARAVVSEGTAAELLVAADLLRWDQARRCAAPLRLTALPPGATLAGCRVDLGAFPQALSATMTLTRTGERWMSVGLQYAQGVAGGRTEGNRTIGGRAAYLYPKGDQLELLGFPKAHLIADFGWPTVGFTEADATALLAGAQVADDLTRPETWQ
ncbi:hypothetical protein [Micromonospora sp. DT47]|uniref:hypothetical protein n=1 Tax=Micromonospora sp. DT47 TaxID=3393431 RepID=UPI003CF6E5E6